jgi:hypothetical protein
VTVVFEQDMELLEFGYRLRTPGSCQATEWHVEYICGDVVAVSERRTCQSLLGFYVVDGGGDEFADLGPPTGGVE